jgi:hypothetical protein
VSGPNQPRGSRRWLLARLGVIGGVVAGGWYTRRSWIEDEEAPEPEPLADVDLEELWRSLPEDTDADDAGAGIEAQLEAIADHGRGGVLYLPPGEWTVREPVRIPADNVALTGAGMRATRLRLAPGVRGHVVTVDGDGVSIERLTIVGNGAAFEGEELGHGIRVGSNARHLLVRDVVVEDVQGYGIGFQPRAERDEPGDVNVGGLFHDVALRNVIVRGSGRDGIDFKNYDWENSACPRESYEETPSTPPRCNGSRSFLRNVSVTGFGQHEPIRDQRGIDIRGQRLLQNIEVLDVPEPSDGVLFRTEVGGRPNGRGGQWSTLEGFYVSMQGGAEHGVSQVDLEGVEVHTGFVVARDETRAFD